MSRFKVSFSIENLRERLTATSAPLLDRPDRPVAYSQTLMPAAVLVPMLETDGGWHLLFIRRAVNGNDYHSGQVAFPGGRPEAGDADLQTTALREAHEEIGLAPRDVDVAGRLGDFISTTNYRIAPFVGIMPWPYRLRLAASEVARAFTIPLDWLSDPENRTTYEHALPSGAVTVIRYRPYDGEVLWGATARMTLSLTMILGLAPALTRSGNSRSRRRVFQHFS
jgi:8-oxo-dGTP pyrophosphatase MutT (NUDIX family)